MQVFSGEKFWPLDPRPDEVHITDIAHSLSLICRYNGHASRFVSVAEHCYRLSYAVEPEHARWALMHDAAEAYVGDMVRPLKQFMPEFSEVEDRVLAVIASRFGLAMPIPDVVHEADTRYLLDERAAMLPNTRHPWGIEELEPLGIEVTGMAPETAEVVFLSRFYELFGNV